MPIEITPLSALSADAVAQTQELLTQLLQEDNATLDLKRGVVHDLLLHYGAVLTTKLRTDLQRYLDSMSLAKIEADPTLADPGVVDDRLSNWGLVRGTGSSAVGEVVIVLSAPNNVTIGAGTAFTANGLTFTANTSYSAKESADLVTSASDRLLTRLTANQWAFTINVTAAAVGTAYLLKKDALMVPAALPLGYLTSYAADDFTGGLDAEDNTSLVGKLQNGIAAKAPSNRINMVASLLANSAYSRVVAQSIVGYGDAEMLRDKHAIFPVAYGGRLDWYVRTQEQALLSTISKAATLLSNDGTDGSTWQVELTRDDAPGFYEIASIRLPGAVNVSGSFAVLSETRGYDLSGAGMIPDIVNNIEAAYSRYQTTIVRFRDTLTDVSAMTFGTTAPCDVTVRMLPDIGAIQDFLGSYEQRPYGCDLLVRAPVPCFLQLSFVIAKKRTQVDPDLPAIRQALATFVNNLDFVGRLYVGQLQEIIHSYLPAGMSVGSIDMHGRIHAADNTDTYVRSESVLVIPNLPELEVGERTTLFFLDAADVGVTISTDIAVPS